MNKEQTAAIAAREQIKTTGGVDLLCRETAAVPDKPGVTDTNGDPEQLQLMSGTTGLTSTALTTASISITWKVVCCRLGGRVTSRLDIYGTAPRRS